MTAKENEYKGHPVLELGVENGRPVTMGLSKLRAVMANLSEVQAFLNKHASAKADISVKKNNDLAF